MHGEAHSTAAVAANAAVAIDAGPLMETDNRWFFLNFYYGALAMVARCARGRDFTVWPIGLTLNSDYEVIVGSECRPRKHY